MQVVGEAEYGLRPVLRARSARSAIRHPSPRGLRVHSLLGGGSGCCDSAILAGHDPLQCGFCVLVYFLVLMSWVLVSEWGNAASCEMPDAEPT